MNRIRISRARRSKNAEINMAPLIDMIFILLIFFIVTTSFVKESGVDIRRPVAKTAVKKENVHLIAEIDKDGNIFIDGKPVDIRSVRPRMKRFAAESSDGAVVIVADRMSNTGIVIQALDECRLAGVSNVSLAARKVE